MTARHDEHGQVGGIEGLVFGVLVFVFGALLVANAWAVVDAKSAASVAAREAARVCVESSYADAVAVEAGLLAFEGSTPAGLVLDRNRPPLAQSAGAEANGTSPAATLLL